MSGQATEPADVAAAIGQLSKYAAMLSWPAQQPDVREAVGRVLRDSLAVLIAGGRLPEARRRRAALPLSDGPATVFGATQTTGVCDAAWLNGCSLVGLELDEGNKTIRGHATAHVLPAVLALAETCHLSGQAMAEAFLAGHEVASRFGRAVMLHPGVHPHGNWGVAGAAAALTRVTSTPAAASAARAARPSISSPMRPAKPTRLPRQARLWATMAEELPSVSAKSEAKYSRSSARRRGRP